MPQMYTMKEYEHLELKMCRVEELKDAFELIMLSVGDATNRPLHLREVRALYAIYNGLEDLTCGSWMPQSENQEVRA